jgi:hypothetical protein
LTKPTEKLAKIHFPEGEHLGDPVDYSVYLIGKLANKHKASPLPDFNLDSDRGYAYRCWDWDRDQNPDNVKTPTGLGTCPAANFQFGEPLTPPESYCDPDHPAGGGNAYKPETPLQIHFLNPGKK